MKGLFFILLFTGFVTGAFATSEKKQIQLRLQASYGSIDQTNLYFDYGVNPTYNAAEDGPKQMSSISGIPNVYSLSSDNVKCTINGFSSLSQSANIEIGTLIDSSSLYTFTLAQYLNFDSTTLVILEDRKLNVFTNMQTAFYQVQLTPSDTTGRFFLHVTSAVQFIPVTAGCNNNDGAISISLDSIAVWSSVALLDSQNSVITSYNNVAGQFNFNGLKEGAYKIALNYNGYACVKNVFVNGTYIVASFNASSQSAAVGENINFYSTATNTTHYVWSFGDSSIITGVANPTFFYYLPGEYIVNLICTNSAGCSATFQDTIIVSEATGIDQTTSKGITVQCLGAKTIQLVMNDTKLIGAEIFVYNILGQSVYTSPVTSEKMTFTINNEPSGIYLVNVKIGNKNSTTKVYINN